MTTRSTHRLLPVILLILTLLTALVIPALAQESAPPTAPLRPMTRGTCTPLSKDEQAIFDQLAQLDKAGQLAGADSDLFLKLSEQAD